MVVGLRFFLYTQSFVVIAVAVVAIVVWLYIEHCAAVRCLHHVESYTQQSRRCRNLNCFEDPSVLLLLNEVLGTRQLHRAYWFEPLRYCW